MNFFSEQDQARRNTKYLILLFVAAVVSLIVITNIFAAVTFWIMDGQLKDYEHAGELVANAQDAAWTHYFSRQNFGKISLFVTGSIFCVVMFKWFQLASGGKRVAESLGGHRINPNTDDAGEKRVLNVVEEMALASGMPVPSVYVLTGEKGINAFAAGNTPADAVIGVTKGALEQFNREQLQGVIAHEFSHILNGDMRLNLRMIALLSGIVFIGTIGELLMRTGGRHGHYHSTKRSGDARVFMLGLGLLVIGWMGTFFGGLIKAAVSRQREFLADASAVQFTRNPQGIADALKIIGGYNAGSRVFSSNASEVSHMFIAEALGSWASFDTHPPLNKRIRKIEPRWNGEMIRRKIKLETNQSANSALNGDNERKRQAALAAAAGAAFVASKKSAVTATTTATTTAKSLSSVEVARASIAAIPHSLSKQVHEPFGASALVYGLLLDNDESVRNKQLSYIEMTGVKGLAMQCLQLQPDIAALDKSQRWPLLELTLPALKYFSVEQYKQFKKTLLLVIRADKRFDMFEWCVFQLVRHYLSAEFERKKTSKPRYKSLKPIMDEYAVVLSCLAWAGHSDEKDASRGFSRAANTAGLYTIELLPVERCGLDDFMKAVSKLANCFPLLKPKVLKSFADCAKLDGEITTAETEIMAALAAVMDCPQPLLEIN